METAKAPSTFQKLWRLLTRGERRQAIVLSVMTIIGMGVETLGIGAVLPALLLITKPDIGESYPALRPVLDALGNPDQRTLIFGGMLALVGVYLAKGVSLGFLAWRQTRFAVRTRVRMTEQLFAIYVHQPYTFHLRRHTPELLRNINAEIGQLTAGGISSAMTLFSELTLMVALGTLLALVEPVGALGVAIVLGAAGGGFYLVTSKRLRDWGAEQQQHNKLGMKHMLQGLWGVKEVQLLGRAEDFLQLFYRHSRRAAQIGENVALLRRLPPLWLEFLAVLGLASVVIAMLWRGLDIATIVPTLALFGAAAFRILPSVSKISGAVGQLRFTEPVIDNLYKEFQLEIPAGRDRRRGAAPHFRSDVRLEGVSFTYPSGHARALSDINFTIKRGDTVGIIGSSGSGKSTLVDVILGLFAPDGGRVTVDGKDIRDDLRAWQDQIGYVPQSIFLTDDSLRRNVAFGIPAEKVDEAAVERALKAAQLDEFVTTLPEGINTVVGERGIRLSGGQRQRIGIARALYHDPAVLVLDEATSALDTATEREFMRAVGALHGEKTILIVAHRLSTVAGCDWLLKLDSGRIVDRGPSREMLGADSDPGRPLDEPSSNVAHS